MRELAMFNLAIDSKLRGCDVVALKVEDVAPNGPPTRLAFEIARPVHKYVEVTYDLHAKRFREVQRIVHIIFGVQG